MRTVLGRCGVLVASAWIALNAFAAEPTIDARAARLQDFDQCCHFVADNYAYFDEKKTDWAAVCDDRRDAAGNAADRAAFIAVLERALDELYDAHAHLGTSTRLSHRLIPTDGDVYARWDRERAVIVEVRAHSQAEAAGLRKARSTKRHCRMQASACASPRNVYGT